MASIKDFENDSPVVSQDSSKVDNLRIFFCGAHSVGKTTLAKEIVKDTDIHIQTEIARKIIREMGMKREDFEPKSQPKRFLELQRRIICAQAGEERHKDEQGLSYVSDRGLDPVVYASVYLGKQEADDLLQLAETKEIVQRYKSSLVFVIKPFPECMREDGIRLRPVIDEMNEFTSVMKNLLQEMCIPYVLIDVLDLKERVKIVRDEINKRQII